MRFCAWHSSQSTLAGNDTIAKQSLRGCWCLCNRPVAQIPQCTSPISHNASFCNRNMQTFVLQNDALQDIGMMHNLWDLWDWSITKLYALSSYTHDDINDMFKFSSLLALCEGNPPVTCGFPSHGASNVELWYFLWCWQEQAIGQTTELPVFGMHGRSCYITVMFDHAMRRHKSMNLLKLHFDLSASLFFHRNVVHLYLEW